MSAVFYICISIFIMAIKGNHNYQMNITVFRSPSKPQHKLPRPDITPSHPSPKTKARTPSINCSFKRFQPFACSIGSPILEFKILRLMSCHSTGFHFVHPSHWIFSSSGTMASTDFLQLVVTAGFGFFPYFPPAKPSRARTTTFLLCNRHIYRMELKQH